MKIFNLRNFKIITLMLASYFISNFFINNVFLANSPKVNPYVLKTTIARLKTTWSKTSSFFASNIKNKLNNRSSYFYEAKNNLPQEVKNALNTTLKQTSKGVYAGEESGVKVFEFIENEIEYIEYDFTLNDGRHIKMKMPKGMSPLTQSQVEALYK